jgi:hypothetical protein
MSIVSAGSELAVAATVAQMDLPDMIQGEPASDLSSYEDSDPDSGHDSDLEATSPTSPAAITSVRMPQVGKKAIPAGAQAGAKNAKNAKKKLAQAEKEGQAKKKSRSKS